MSLSAPASNPDTLHRTGVILAVAGAIAFSGKAIIVKLAYRYGVDASTLIMYRMLFALPLFMLMTWWAERQPAARSRPLSQREWLGVIGLGFLGYYFSSYLDFLGLQYVSAGLERLILYLNPTLVLVLGWLIFRRPLEGRRMLAMGISYSGVLLVFGHEVVWAGGLGFFKRHHLCLVSDLQWRDGQKVGVAAPGRLGQQRGLFVLHRPVFCVATHRCPLGAKPGHCLVGAQ